MQKEVVLLKKFIADEGMVFDWAEPHYHKEMQDGKEVEVRDHLNAVKLFLGENDDIENYVEVKKDDTTELHSK